MNPALWVLVGLVGLWLTILGALITAGLVKYGREQGWTINRTNLIVPTLGLLAIAAVIIGVTTSDREATCAADVKVSCYR